MSVWKDTGMPLDPSVHTEWVDAIKDVSYNHCRAFGRVEEANYMALVPCSEINILCVEAKS